MHSRRTSRETIGEWMLYRTRLPGLGVWRCASPRDDLQCRVRVDGGTLMLEHDDYEAPRFTAIPWAVIERLREFATMEDNGT